MTRAHLVLVCALLLAGCTVRGPAPLPAPGGGDLTALLLWTIGAAMVGIAASVAALVWLPTKKLALAGIAGFGALLACALSVKVIQPYLGWIVLGLFAIGAGVAIYFIRKYHLFSRDMSVAVTADEVAKVIDDHPVIAKALKLTKAAV